MNSIDLLTSIVLLLAVWNGWRQGFIVQVFSLAGIVAGIWLAARYGAAVGEWLGLDEAVSAAGGFVVVLLLVILAVAVAARLVRKLFHFAGFGLPDIVLGIAVSVLKYLLVLSVLFSAFDSLNADYSLVGPGTIERSRTYGPVLRLSEHVLPFLERVGEQVKNE
ncbi:CvpA family protein [Alistipes sp.]|uniref:CvpA family protein n=1 Tax=Alistipes sp. TaxID=1872444 RepID=UPI003AEF7662